MNVIVLLSKAYPHTEFKGNPQKALSLLEKIRDHLDDLVFKENPRVNGDELKTVYYCADEWKRRKQQHYAIIDGGKE